jgi:hypothetical protein
MNKLVLGIALLFAVTSCQEEASDDNSKSKDAPVQPDTTSVTTVIEEVPDEQTLVTTGLDSLTFTDYLEKLAKEGHEINSEITVTPHELGNDTRTFYYQLSFSNMKEALLTLQALNMFEIDDFVPVKHPQSSGRKLNIGWTDDMQIIPDEFSINGKAYPLEVEVGADEMIKTYRTKTSKIKTFEFEGETQEYSDELSISVAYHDGKLYEFEIEATLNGFLSEDELVTNNSDNSMALDHLRAADKDVQNSVYAICNGYTSSVTLRKVADQQFELEFNIFTPGCAL